MVLDFMVCNNFLYFIVCNYFLDFMVCNYFLYFTMCNYFLNFTVCNFRVCNYATLTDAHAAENIVRLWVEEVEVVRVVGALDLQLLNTANQTNTNANRRRYSDNDTRRID